MRMTTLCCKSIAALALTWAAFPASASSLDDYRAAFARAVYAASPQWVHNRNPQPLLRAVVVLRLRMSPDRHIEPEVIRSNDTQPEMLQRAIEAARHAQAPTPSAEVEAELMRNGFMETWLFDSDGRFQVKTLAKPQRGA